jgi:hypothetical protein
MLFMPAVCAERFTTLLVVAVLTPAMRLCLMETNKKEITSRLQ